jgi:hypothetical protein
MYKAQLTEVGAYMLGHEELTGATIEYDGIAPLGLCINNIYYKGRRLGAVLSFEGDDPGVTLLTHPDDSEVMITVYPKESDEPG